MGIIVVNRVGKRGSLWFFRMVCFVCLMGYQAIAQPRTRAISWALSAMNPQSLQVAELHKGDLYVVVRAEGKATFENATILPKSIDNGIRPFVLEVLSKISVVRLDKIRSTVNICKSNSVCDRVIQVLDLFTSYILDNMYKFIQEKACSFFDCVKVRNADFVPSQWEGTEGGATSQIVYRRGQKYGSKKFLGQHLAVATSGKMYEADDDGILYLTVHDRGYGSNKRDQYKDNRGGYYGLLVIQCPHK